LNKYFYQNQPSIDSQKKQIIIIGGGLAGLSSAMKICELTQELGDTVVQIFSTVPVKRSHSVCAQGGINAANTISGDSTYQHFDDTIYGGDFLANQTPVKKMCEAAPDIINLFDRLGVPFNRTSEKNIARRKFGGALYPRTAHAGASTGQQLLYALDEQVRKYEAEGLVQKFERWEYLSSVFDDDKNICGIVAQDLVSMEIKAFYADAVVIASGGPGLVYALSTNGTTNTALAVTSLYKQGAKYANPEFIQIHPTAVGGDDKKRLMSESARGEGARVWVPGDSSKTWIDNSGNERPCGQTGSPWYFLEEKYPGYGNLVPRDIAARELFDVVYKLKMGISGKPFVYLDVTEIVKSKGKEYVDKKLKAILEIYEKFKGADPREVPMEIFPAVHYSMGGLWVDDENHMTSLPGVFAAGECDYQYHGANRLGANSLLSCVYTGLLEAGPKALKFAMNRSKKPRETEAKFFEDQVKKEYELFEKILKLDPEDNRKESLRELHLELGRFMTQNVTIVREEKGLQETYEKIEELEKRFWDISIPDRTRWCNQFVVYARQVLYMFDLAKAIVKGALERKESRGAHLRTDYPNRLDEEFLKTTVVLYNSETKSPEVSFEEVDTSLIKPRKRDYTKASYVGKK